MKYAIYSTSYGGFYAYEYIDTLNGCKNILGGHLIREIDLPVIVNHVGGHCSFDPNQDNFVKIIECRENEEPLTREQMYPKNSDKFKYGWIDTEGNTYACGHTDHIDSADCICKELGYDTYNGEAELENRGWIKVTASWRGGRRETRVYPHDGFVTKRQYETLFDLGLHDIDYIIQGAIYYSEKQW